MDEPKYQLNLSEKELAALKALFDNGSGVPSNHIEGYTAISQRLRENDLIVLDADDNND